MPWTRVNSRVYVCTYLSSCTFTQNYRLSLFAWLSAGSSCTKFRVVKNNLNKHIYTYVHSIYRCMSAKSWCSRPVATTKSWAKSNEREPQRTIASIHIYIWIHICVRLRVSAQPMSAATLAATWQQCFRDRRTPTEQQSDRNQLIATLCVRQKHYISWAGEAWKK